MADEYTWYIDSGGSITNTQFISLLEPAMSKPYPLALWRIERGVNAGLPFNGLFPEIEAIHYKSVPQYDYIIVYDMANSQFNFYNNGLAVLCPTSCTVREELNGIYSVDMEHPIDSEGKWKYLLEFNHIKVLDQLFTIKNVEHIWNGNSGKVRIYAEHIFYQLNDPWIFPGESAPMTTSANALLSWAKMSATYLPSPTSTIYNFESSSDIAMSADDYPINKWQEIDSGMSAAEFIMGDGGVIAVCGGELYRDNFYFSLNERMENAGDNAFEIRVGMNLKGITRKIDLSTFCTYFRAYDNFGSWWGVSYDPSKLPRAFPHNIVRSQNFSYDEYSMEELVKDGMNYWNANCAPLISYTIKLEDARDNPDFEEFSNLPRYKVGDKGKIYDERLGCNLTLEITKTVTDGITGKVKEVTFGEIRKFTKSRNYDTYIAENYAPDSIGGAVQLKDKNGVLLFDSAHTKLMEEVKI